jgi:hypothetical protein
MQAISVWTTTTTKDERKIINQNILRNFHQSFVCKKILLGNLLIDRSAMHKKKLKIFPIYLVQIPQKKSF